ncbi:MAG: FAD-dependent oxidoreductase [Deltaproteobacteria bacterium]
MRRIGEEAFPLKRRLRRLLPPSADIVVIGSGVIAVETQEELHAMGLFVGDQKELPILGPVPGAEGLFMATGHEGDGIALSPVTGWITAEWIVGGSPGMDVSSFSLGRFMSPPN